MALFVGYVVWLGKFTMVMATKKPVAVEKRFVFFFFWYAMLYR